MSSIPQLSLPFSPDDWVRALEGMQTLTPRETEVLQAIIDGLTSKEIGARLGISPRTVEVHRLRVIEKINVGNSSRMVSAVSALISRPETMVQKVVLTGVVRSREVRGTR